MDRVSVHRVDRAMMFTLFVSPSSLHFSLVISLLAHDCVSLFRTDQEFVRMGILVIAEASTSIDLSFRGEVSVLKYHFISRLF
jgi:hypothetical protein